MTELRYGNTKTFYIKGDKGGLLVDTDYAGTLPAFYRALKQNGIAVKDISFVLATHYHPDHMGLIGDLQKQGVKLLLIDVQKDHVRFSDGIFLRDGIPFSPVDETKAETISCAESRAFLADIGICGEIVSTPSHSADSVTLILDNGDCIAGDLEPYEYIDAYEDNPQLRADWELLMSYRQKRVLFSHRPESMIR
ncbi:MAG: MBL fold metallo-hydrolase [Oscillospiraceae bacterium]|nr:MBL fold metallo-hydrolase [Oscillospiraceae bacterium]